MDFDVTSTVLRPEHELLGADFAVEEWLDAEVPASYGDVAAETSALADGVGLCDVSGMAALLVSGGDAEALVRAACAREPLAVGECGFTAVLTGDGALASVPLVARTGDEEYLLWDASARADMLAAWMGFLAGIEQEGSAPFAEAAVEDVSERLVPLLVAGPGARAVLLDYTNELPEAGTVAQVALDEIQCLVTGLPEVLGPGWLVLVGPRFARVLWRSLLSFTEVTPVGWKALGEFAAGRLSWLEYVRTGEHAVVAGDELRGCGLARNADDFVGARALR